MSKSVATKRLLTVVVAFESERVVEATLAALCPQLTEEDAVLVVDNGNGISLDCQNRFSRYGLRVMRGAGNIGFCKGNNVGLEVGQWWKFKSVLFLNPDLVLPKGWVDRAIARAEGSGFDRIGILSGPLLKYDFAVGRTTGVVDSLGITRSRFSGRWYDSGSGQPYTILEGGLPDEFDVQAVCGALMLIPTQVIAEVIVDKELFDERFFAYKEDIDLSLRIRNASWRLLLAKSLIAYHGRGWAPSRTRVPFKSRALSARNEVMLNAKHLDPYVCVSLLKMLYVFTVERFLAKRKECQRE